MRLPSSLAPLALGLSAALLAGCTQALPQSPSLGTPAPSAAAAAREPGPPHAVIRAQAPGAEAQKADVPNQVVMDNFVFTPAKLTVAVGTKVTWVNRDDVPHSATSSSRPRAFDSKTLDTDERFEFVFKAAGTYDYFCTLHPKMIGQIIVK